MDEEQRDSVEIRTAVAMLRLAQNLRWRNDYWRGDREQREPIKQNVCDSIRARMYQDQA